jgi:hypothetical protein
MRGERRVAMQPMVLGHEAAGVVEAIGDQVQGVSPGDHVVLTFIPGCGRCRWCQRGLHHLCAEGPRITHGPQLDGSFRRRDHVRDGLRLQSAKHGNPGDDLQITTGELRSHRERFQSWLRQLHPRRVSCFLDRHQLFCAFRYEIMLHCSAMVQGNHSYCSAEAR